MTAAAPTYPSRLAAARWDPPSTAPIQPACRDHPTLPPDAWFPPAGRLPPESLAAIAVCQRCPLLDPCRDWAREQMPAGIWGGEAHADRRRWRDRQRKAASRQLARTDRGETR